MVDWLDVWCATDCSAARLARWQRGFGCVMAWLEAEGTAVLGDDASTEALVAARADCEEALRQRWDTAPIAHVPVGDLPEAWRAGLRGAFLTVVGSPPERPDAAIVGTRRVDTTPGLPLDDFVRALVDACPGGVVSGGAFGVDTLAHRAALQTGRPAWVVVASGAAKAGPQQQLEDFREVVASGGGVLSNRAPRVPANRGGFLRRNQVIAALPPVTVVVRSGVPGGALSTAEHARQLGRKVLAVPAAPWERGADGVLQLLRGGAGVCDGPDALRAAIGRAAQGELFDPGPPAPRAPLSAPAQAIVDAVGRGARTVEALTRVLDAPAATTQALVLALVLDGDLVEGCDGLSLAAGRY